MARNGETGGVSQPVDRGAFTGDSSRSGANPPIDRIVTTRSSAERRSQTRSVTLGDYSEDDWSTVRAYTERAAALPSTLDVILADPTATLDVNIPEDADRLKTLEVATFQRTDAPVLDHTWALLAKRVSDTRAPLTQRLAASMTADALLDQTGRPAVAKTKGRFDSIEKVADAWHVNALVLLQDRATDRKALSGIIATRNLRKATGMDPVSTFENLLSVDAPNVVQGQIGVIDEYMRLEKGTLFAVCNELTEEQGVPAGLTQIVQDHSPRIFRTPEAAEALFSGSIEETTVDVRYPIWQSNVFRESVPGSGVRDDTADESVDTYFLEHPDVQKVFWDKFLGERSDGTLDNTGLAYSIRFLQTHPDQSSALVRTIPIADFDKGEQRRLIRQVAGVVGLLHNDLAAAEGQEDDHARQMRADLLELTRRAKVDGMLDEEIGVLEDRVPGVLVLNGRYEAHARRAPAPSDISVVHTSLAQEGDSALSRERTDTRLHVVGGEEHHFPDWHGQPVQAAQLEEVGSVVSHMGTNLQRTGLTRRTIDDQVWKLAGKERLVRSNAPTVIPALLPLDHPLRKLGDAGIRAVVSEKEGYDFSVLVDAGKAGIAVEGDQTIALTGEVVDPEEGKTIEILGADANGSDIHEALRGAVLLGRRPVTPEVLSGSELRTVREAMQGWKEQGLQPPLVYEGTNPTPDTEKVLFIAGKKSVLLTVQEPKVN